MGEIMEFLNQLLNQIVELAILLCEYTGVLVIAVSSVRGIIDYIKGNPQTRLNLAKGMAMGLEFKVGSEILRTVVVREVQEIFIVASIIALRALLTFLIHWEIKNEERNGSSGGSSEKAGK
ncbi:DUF1622 domain-containing protein [Murimonas intestini]|nr:DUF1622 domain-containing protein [Murimonas intestini]MCR1840534.1 DUF1622 domain-containing protein [Murimonas intestini]MCR1865412.1 DUF1622 domain-containing protein [Murimonas intestini]MCR1882877.1 DUF1622 domain-containing protein [Murimonas intestini]